MNTLSSKIASAAVVVALAATTTGCHIYKKFEVPEQSTLGQEYVQAGEQEQDSTALGNLPWQQVFTDPVLADLISQALDNNKDLENARLNIEVAHANMLGARLSYLPSLALAPSIGNLTSPSSTLKTWSYQIPLTASWEVDIFGKILNNKRSAEAAHEQTKYYAQAVRSQIIGGVANCYYAISALEAQLMLQRSTAESWERSVKMMADMKEAGFTNEAAVVQSRAQYYSILASIRELETAAEEAHNTLSLLLNQMPQRWSIEPGLSLEMPDGFHSGVPMSALAARPDIHAQEKALAIAYYATNSARAAFYPGLTITANGGWTDLIGNFVASPKHWFYSLGASLAAPLFARGQNIARLKATKAQQEQALNNFEYALMSASAEVSSALTAYANNDARIELLTQQTEQMSKAVDITETLFMNPNSSQSTTYLEVLTAQQNYLGVQMNLINSTLERTRSIVNLYQALGGGR